MLIGKKEENRSWKLLTVEREKAKQYRLCNTYCDVVALLQYPLWLPVLPFMKSICSRAAFIWKLNAHIVGAATYVRECYPPGYSLTSHQSQKGRIIWFTRSYQHRFCPLFNSGERARSRRSIINSSSRKLHVIGDKPPRLGLRLSNLFRALVIAWDHVLTCYFVQIPILILSTFGPLKFYIDIKVFASREIC